MTHEVKISWDSAAYMTSTPYGGLPMRAEGLSEGQRATFEAIVSEKVGKRGQSVPREAWSRWDDIEAIHPGALSELVRLGVAARWERPDYTAVTLTPFGAWMAEHELDERWKFERQPVDDPKGPKHTVAVPEQVWVATGLPSRPCRRPRYAEERGIRLEELAIDPAPTPDTLVDDEGEEVRLFAGGGGKGIPVRLDRRIKPARKVKGRGRLRAG